MPKPKTCLTTKNGRPNEANKEKECFDERQRRIENLVPPAAASSQRSPNCDRCALASNPQTNLSIVRCNHLN